MTLSYSYSHVCNNNLAVLAIATYIHNSNCQFTSYICMKYQDQDFMATLHTLDKHSNRTRIIYTV